jgi:hypothetical protein
MTAILFGHHHHGGVATTPPLHAATSALRVKHDAAVRAQRMAAVAAGVAAAATGANANAARSTGGRGGATAAALSSHPRGALEWRCRCGTLNTERRAHCVACKTHRSMVFSGHRR